MLHEETIERTTLELLTALMHDPMMVNFNLAGGTALALYIGHRKSIDLDLFTSEPFDATELGEYLTRQYGFVGTFNRENTLKGTIDGVAVDCITHAYPLTDPVVVSPEGIRLYSMRDIAAMKLSAIADNGSRLKDFIDVAYLSTYLSLADMLQAYEVKFPNSTGIRPIKGLTFFNDIDFDEPIHLIGNTYNWKYVAKRLTDMVRQPRTVFSSRPEAPSISIRRTSLVTRPKNTPKKKKNIPRL